MKYCIRKGQQLRPHGGHHYHAHGIKFEGDNHKDVYEKLTTYRLNNTIPIGDPEQEVLSYYAREFPWMVDEVEALPSIKKNDYYARWRAFVQNTWKHPLTRTITAKEASSRWDVCAKCPYNVKLSVGSSQEGQELLRRTFLLRRGQEVPAKLGFCSLHSFDIGVASLLETPVEVSGKMKDAANAPDCWVV